MSWTVQQDQGPGTGLQLAIVLGWGVCAHVAGTIDI